MKISGNIVDIHSREIYQGTIDINDGVIASITRCETKENGYIMVGFVDAHVHIESSMLTPQNFGRLVIEHGTVAVVTDPHEIANVLGKRGIEIMMESSKSAPIKIFFSIPSCIPATPFDSAGCVVTAAEVAQLAESGEFVALSEMMNAPGVIYRDEEVMAKLAAAKRCGLPIDGHAPALDGEWLTQYVESGITTDHEIISIEEARRKIELGMKVQIREGSAARNYQALAPLIKERPEMLMFCTDDSHPDDIIERGHIDKLVRRAIAEGYDLFDVLRIASLNAIEHYSLSVGTLQVGDKADFIVVEDLVDFKVRATYVDGRKINVEDASKEDLSDGEINKFNHDHITLESLKCAVEGEITAIGLIKDEIITSDYKYSPSSPTENLEADLEADILKIVYLNRYNNTPPVVAFAHGFGLQRGAFASSISHDSHNILAVGTSDTEILTAINELIDCRGALVTVDGETINSLPLPIAGIMSDQAGEEVAEQYRALNKSVEEMGSPLKAPFMTLSFMSLVVIPEIKIGEKGLFSYSKFSFI